MATTGDKSLRVFLDTNIILRFHVLETPEHIAVRSAVEGLLKSHNELWISRQVLREFAMVLTRPQTFVITHTSAEVVKRIHSFSLQFQIADETTAVTAQWLSLLERIPVGGKQVHDANIVATMLAYDIPRLFTLNTEDFARYRHLITLISLDEVLHDTNMDNA